MQVFFQKNPQIKHLCCKCISVSLFYLTAFLKCEKQNKSELIRALPAQKLQ